MDINVNIRLESPDIMNALLALAEALSQIKLGAVLPIKEVQAVETESSVIKTESNNEELLKEEIKTISLEDVREKLALISQSGKQPKVKELITKYGAVKLTDIDPSCYEELLKEAEVL